MRLAHELRQKVQAHRFPDGIYQPGGALTISCGVACFPEDSRKAENLIRCAEGGVAEAKRKGRNTVVPARPDFLT
jgi:diguanylate cyclase (GGDEF)-like protein